MNKNFDKLLHCALGGQNHHFWNGQKFGQEHCWRNWTSSEENWSWFIPWTCSNLSSIYYYMVEWETWIYQILHLLNKKYMKVICYMNFIFFSAKFQIAQKKYTFCLPNLLLFLFQIFVPKKGILVYVQEMFPDFIFPKPLECVNYSPMEDVGVTAIILRLWTSVWPIVEVLKRMSFKYPH